VGLSEGKRREAFCCERRPESALSTPGLDNPLKSQGRKKRGFMGGKRSVKAPVWVVRPAHWKGKTADRKERRWGQVKTGGEAVLREGPGLRGGGKGLGNSRDPGPSRKTPKQASLSMTSAKKEAFVKKRREGDLRRKRGGEKAIPHSVGYGYRPQGFSDESRHSKSDGKKKFDSWVKKKKRVGKGEKGINFRWVTRLQKLLKDQTGHTIINPRNPTNIRVKGGN